MSKLNNKKKYDVIVVGGGHAGIEAAYASANLGSRTLLVTIDKNKIALAPCNPSIGGLGKGHIVYEIGAFNGLMPKLCSKAHLQARMLNTKKGPAVQGLRVQVDKYKYSSIASQILSQTKNLEIFEGQVTDLFIEDVDGIRSVSGVKVETGESFFASSVVITTGTFLNGTIHIGSKVWPGGRNDEEAASHLTASLEAALGVKFGRLKTGTPPRILKESVDFSALEKQDAHKLDYLYEFDPVDVTEQVPCYITHTNEETHKIIQENISRSALFSGGIKGIGPRYCPSIEDKISRFPGRSMHHVFIEPEGLDHEEIYPAGVSTSLPEDVQEAYIRTIKGLENAVISKFGYAIEYDFLQPSHLKHSLESKNVEGLFFAGQVNGTTGYEEAAGQGLVAGINAHQKMQNKEPLILQRDESYIGVMIDDLVTIGVDEPYRMFTSRAERRLLLRQDNTFLRLMPCAKELGLISDDTYSRFLKEKELIEVATKEVQKDKGELFKSFSVIEFDEASRFKAKEYLTSALLDCGIEGDVVSLLSSRVLLCIHAEIKYVGYLARELKEVEKANKYKNVLIPDGFEYRKISGLSIELQEKLTRFKPKSIAQAQLIPGMTPAAISLLIFQLKLSKKDKDKVS